MKPRRLTNSAGIFIVRSESAPKGVSGVNSGAGHSFTYNNTHDCNVPGSPVHNSRGAGDILFSRDKETYLWKS